MTPREASEDGRQFSAAVARNSAPLLQALQGILPEQGVVLEIGSGTGEHAVMLASHFPKLVFQPSDPDEVARQSIAAWIASSQAGNVRAPIDLDAQRATASDLPEQGREVRAMMAANVIHISPWETCLGILRLAGELLPTGAPLALYGPYRRSGRHTAASNQAFDEMLQSRNSSWGVRDLDEVAKAAGDVGLELAETIEMPANNLVVVFRNLRG